MTDYESPAIVYAQVRRDFDLSLPTDYRANIIDVDGFSRNVGPHLVCCYPNSSEWLSSTKSTLVVSSNPVNLNHAVSVREKLKEFNISRFNANNGSSVFPKHYGSWNS